MSAAKKLGTVAAVLFAFGLAGCTSVGSAGMMLRRTADPAKLATRSYRELGPAEGTGCRCLVVGVLPLGNADPAHVLDEILQAKGADALINVATSNSLYGFVPIYNVFSITCTTLSGTAISFEPARVP